MHIESLLVTFPLQINQRIYNPTLRDKQFKDDLAKMKEELGRRQEAKAEASSSAAAAES